MVRWLYYIDNVLVGCSKQSMKTNKYAFGYCRSNRENHLIVNLRMFCKLKLFELLKHLAYYKSFPKQLLFTISPCCLFFQTTVGLYLCPKTVDLWSTSKQLNQSYRSLKTSWLECRSNHFHTQADDCLKVASLIGLWNVKAMWKKLPLLFLLWIRSGNYKAVQPNFVDLMRI